MGGIRQPLGPPSPAGRETAGERALYRELAGYLKNPWIGSDLVLGVLASIRNKRRSDRVRIDNLEVLRRFLRAQPHSPVLGKLELPLLCTLNAALESGRPDVERVASDVAREVVCLDPERAAMIRKIGVGPCVLLYYKRQVLLQATTDPDFRQGLLGGLRPVLSKRRSARRIADDHALAEEFITVCLLAFGSAGWSEVEGLEFVDWLESLADGPEFYLMRSCCVATDAGGVATCEDLPDLLVEFRAALEGTRERPDGAA